MAPSQPRRLDTGELTASGFLCQAMVRHEAAAPRHRGGRVALVRSDRAARAAPAGEVVALHNVNASGPAGAAVLLPGALATGAMTIGAGTWANVHQPALHAAHGSLSSPLPRLSCRSKRRRWSSASRHGPCHSGPGRRSGSRLRGRRGAAAHLARRMGLWQRGLRGRRASPALCPGGSARRSIPRNERQRAGLMSSDVQRPTHPSVTSQLGRALGFVEPP